MTELEDLFKTTTKLSF